MAKEADQNNLQQPHLCQQSDPKGQFSLEKYRCDWQDVSSGWKSSNHTFEEWVYPCKPDGIALTKHFDLNCVGCCWRYLVMERNYHQVIGVFEDDRVEFRRGEVTPLAQTRMFVDCLRTEGVVKVDKLHDANHTRTVVSWIYLPVLQ